MPGWICGIKHSPLGLRESGVYADRREVALLEQGIQLSRPRDRLHKYADLFGVRSKRSDRAHSARLLDFKVVEELVELLLKLKVVLLKTVESQFSLVVHVDLERLWSESAILLDVTCLSLRFA